MMTPDQLAERVGAKRNSAGWMARCPAHDDGTASLSIREGDAGGTLLRCFAGCSFDRIVSAIGIEVGDITPERERRSPRQIVAAYPYQDSHGTLLYEAIRYQPKEFRQRRPDGHGGWTWNLRGVNRVLYRLSELEEAVAFGRRVFIAEGEKDVEALVAGGECATTWAGGANNWASVAEHARQVLDGADVVMCADGDVAGRACARNVVVSLRDIASAITVVEALTGNDAADHLGAGHGVNDFMVIASSDPVGDTLSIDQWLAGPADTPTDTPTEDRAPASDALHLPRAFYEERPVLHAISQAARSQRVPPDSALAVVLARVTFLTPNSIVLPALVGSKGSLNLFVGLIGGPGSGKTTSKRLGVDLLPSDGRRSLLDDMPLGSGEGIVDAYFELVRETGPNGKGVQHVKRQTRSAVFFYTDEGGAIAEVSSRRGSTTMSTLRAGWTGDTLGATNASMETRRRIPQGQYRLALVVGFQPSTAQVIVDDAATGTAARFIWAMATDPDAPDEPPAWPGPLLWSPPEEICHDGKTPSVQTMTVHDDIRNEVATARLTALRGAAAVNDVDAHANLARLKIAGTLAILDRRLDINIDDWRLAGTYMRTSNAVREYVVITGQIDARKREESTVARTVRREGAVVEDRISQGIERMAKAIGRHVHKGACDQCTRRCASRSTASADRHLATIDDAIDRALTLQWITVHEEGEHKVLRPGKARPI